MTIEDEVAAALDCRRADKTRLSSAPHLCRPVEGVLFVADDGDFCC